jgi:hypothetical protein
MNICCNCGKKIPDLHSYCTWDCQIDAWRKSGGVECCPNGLPVRCLRSDGVMLEHAAADHHDYKFPIQVEFVGQIPADHKDWDHSYENELHALIYSDGFIAVTICDCSYFMWYVNNRDNGRYGGKEEWYKEWRLTDDALEKCRKFRKE